MVKRTVSEFNITAFDFDDDGNKIIFGTCQCVATSLTKTQARAALKDVGVPCPKGCRIKVVERSSITYACTLEDFISVAQPIDKKEL